MEQIVSENLFLLEFVVDKCLILPCALPKEVHDIIGETCISFSFLKNEPQNVCEEDFCPKRKYGAEEENMKSGKSCLFALSSSQAYAALKEFDITVGVFKKMKVLGEIPDDKVQIGKAVVPVAKTFNEIIEMAKKNKEENKKDTVAKSLKDCYNIVNIKDEIIGSIGVFVRISCFGKVIVTQFQMNLEEKSVFFKDQEGKSLYKYRRANKNEMDPGGDKKCKPYRSTTFAGDQKPADQDAEGDGRCEDCNPPGTCPEDEEPPPPYGYDKDVFVMRIGKKTDCKGKKPRLEVIMVTPKAPSKKPFPTKKENETQFDENDCPGGKKKKGKKDKGKKGGKKKKGKGDDGDEKEKEEKPKEDDKKKDDGKKDDKDKKAKKADSKDDKDKKPKEKESAMPSYAGMILLKERKKDDECCKPAWCQPQPCMPSQQIGKPCSCYSTDYSPTYIYAPSPSSCGMSWDTPSNITLQCSKGRIRSACCY